MAEIKNFCKMLISKLVGEYSPYYVYGWRGGTTGIESDIELKFEVRPLNDAQLAAADALMLEQVGYMGSESLAFGCFIGEQLAGVCFYWFGERYKRRNFWPLKPWEAKLVQIIVSPALRGRGVASALVKGSSLSMKQSGFNRLYARIWHSNGPSLTAFEKAGWERIAFVLEINPFRSKKPMRMQWTLLKKY